MFPYANYNPTLSAQMSSHSVIASLICRNLIDPVTAVGVWNPTMLWATINKKGYSFFWKDKIWFSLEWKIPSPARNPCSAKKRDNCGFC